jgi:beta-lactam-binding protein with PASTA domain
VTAPPPPPPDERLDDPTLVGPGRRVVVDEDVPQRVVRPYPWWLWALVVLLLAAAVTFLVLWLMERNEGKDVPSLVGMTLVQAQDEASSEGFTLKTVRIAAAAAPGTVVDQAPQAGADLEDGSQVMAVVSAGREQVTVPNLVGSTADAAEQLLDSVGLQAERKTVDSPKPQGTVVAQDPADGTQVPKSSTVTLSVSSGKGQVKVPAVIGMSQAGAVAAVVNAGLVPVVITVPSHEPAQTVISQDPPANQEVPARSKLRVNVSGGPTQTQTLTVTTSETTTTATTVTTTTP